MLIKISKYLFLFLAIFLWLQAYSPWVYKSTGLFPDDYRYGDLYRLSYLPEFKAKSVNCDSTTTSKSDSSNTNLYVIGDSFTEEARVKKSDFLSEHYTYTHWEKQADIQLDTTKRNILILETVERTFKDHFSKEVRNFSLKNQPNSNLVSASWKQNLKNKVAEIVLFCFPKGIEERLEHTLFNYDFFLSFREFKAHFNLLFFNRIEKKVMLSKDKKNIYYSEEADSNDTHSAFYPVEQAEIDTFVSTINAAREKYLKAGFNEVYLSIIPNKVSVLSPDLGNYNHLVERIQLDSRVKTPIIDTFSDFRKSPSSYYLKSDTHWNCEGRNVWLAKINLIIENKKVD
jgi:hypothetical protein